MKSIYYRILIIVCTSIGLGIFVSCGEKSQKTKTIVQDEYDEYYEFQDFMLRNFDIQAVVKLPDETANIGASTNPEVIHEESHLWTINVGNNFQLEIEDHGIYEDVIETEKSSLDRDFYKVNYLKDKDEIIVYERLLTPKGADNASKDVGVEHKTYHVVGQKKIDGITYRLASKEEGFQDKRYVDIIEKSIRSFRPESEL